MSDWPELPPGSPVPRPPRRDADDWETVRDAVGCLALAAIIMAFLVMGGAW